MAERRFVFDPLGKSYRFLAYHGNLPQGTDLNLGRSGHINQATVFEDVGVNWLRLNMPTDQWNDLGSKLWWLFSKNEYGKARRLVEQAAVHAARKCYPRGEQTPTASQILSVVYDSWQAWVCDCNDPERGIEDAQVDGGRLSMSLPKFEVKVERQLVMLVDEDDETIVILRWWSDSTAPSPTPVFVNEVKWPEELVLTNTARMIETVWSSGKRPRIS